MMTTPNRMTATEIGALMDRLFPNVHEGSGRLIIEAVPPRQARVRMLADPRNLRPGGTVSGPMLFKIADFAIYVAIVADLGEAAVPAVTTSLTINFLSRPGPTDVIADAKLIKVGRRLAVAEVEIYSDGQPDMVAHATASYAMPPLK